MHNKERYFNVKKMTELIKSIIEKITEKTHLSKKLLPAVLLLLFGIIALLISELPIENKSASAQTTSTTAADINSYAEQLETRLISIISSIDGAGDTKVMVTLESGSEDIYLHNYDYGENVDPSGKNSMERKDEYVIVDGSDGEQGIVVRIAEPTVRGVAVVCEGGGSEIVREQIINAVTALLDISSARVSVAKMS